LIGWKTALVRLSAFPGNSICHWKFPEIKTKNFGGMKSALGYVNVLIFVLHLIGQERSVECLLLLVRPGTSAI